MDHSQRYSRLLGDETTKEEQWPLNEHDVAVADAKRSPFWSARLPSRAYLLLVIGVFFSIGITIYGGFRQMTRNRQQQLSQLGWIEPVGTVHTTLKYDKRYTVSNNNDTESPWKDLFPTGGGFVQHPSISPERGCIAVYHQLHCLDAIRDGYWSARDGVEPSHHARPAHVRHCIDYLRQSLMCHADTNIEPIDPELMGATGFDSEKQCRDFSSLGDWAEKYHAPMPGSEE